jgi:RNA polymerase sigma-70 factor (ECF subfamily)
MELKAGNESAFTEIFNRYRSMLYLEAYYQLKDHQEAQDIVQDVFTWLWLKKDTVPATVALKQYLFKATRNKCIDKHRKVKTIHHFTKEYPYLKETDTNYVPLETKELSHQLANAINAISAPASRRAFQLLYLEDKSHKTIALEMGTNVQTVKNQISRALKVLRGKLKNV